MYDLCVVGGGPHALSLVSRILEQSPASLLNDQQHNHLSRVRRGHQYKEGNQEFKERIVVIDKT